MPQNTMDSERPNSQVEYSVPTDVAQCEKAIRQMHPGMSITHCSVEDTTNGYVRDMEWNAFDYWHRIYVHHTYNDALQVIAGKNFSVNVTRWGSLPIFIQVSNAWIRPGVLLQDMTVLGIIFCHQIIRFIQDGDKIIFHVDWWTASHWLFRPLHGPFNARMMKLQKVQFEEDRDIRDQRFALRKRGFRFTTDNPDFINSNELTDNAIVPPFPETARVSIKGLAAGQSHKIEVGPLAFWVKPNGAAIEVWPAFCPHEGAALEEKHLCNGIYQCPWHGRKFKSITLELGKRTHWQFLNVAMDMEGTDLVMTRLGDQAGRLMKNEFSA